MEQPSTLAVIAVAAGLSLYAGYQLGKRNVVTETSNKISFRYLVPSKSVQHLPAKRLDYCDEDISTVRSSNGYFCGDYKEQNDVFDMELSSLKTESTSPKVCRRKRLASLPDLLVEDESVESSNHPTESPKKFVSSFVAEDNKIPARLSLQTSERASSAGSLNTVSPDKSSLYSMLKALESQAVLLLDGVSSTIHIHNNRKDCSLVTVNENEDEIPSPENADHEEALMKALSSAQPLFFFAQQKESEQKSCREDEQQHLHICTSLRSRNGKCVHGVLEVVCRPTDQQQQQQPGADIPQDTLNRLKAHAKLTGRVLAMAAHHKESEKVSQRCESLVALSERVLALTHPKCVVERLCLEGRSFLPAEHTAVLLLDAQGTHFLQGHPQGGAAGGGRGGEGIPVDGGGTVGLAVKRGQPVILNNVHQDPTIQTLTQDLPAGVKVRNMMVMPIPTHATLDYDLGHKYPYLGVILWVNSVGSGGGGGGGGGGDDGRFSRRDVSLARGFTAIAGLALSTSLHLDRLRQEGANTGSRQVEFFGETTVIPDKKHKFRRASQVAGAQQMAAQKMMSSTEEMIILEDEELPSASSQAFDSQSTPSLDSPSSRLKSRGGGSGGGSRGGGGGASGASGGGGDGFPRLGLSSCDRPAATLEEALALERTGSGSSTQSGSLNVLHGDDLPITFDPAKLVGDAAAMDDWFFDALKYSDAQLVPMTVCCFQAFDIPRQFQVPLPRLTAWVTAVLSNYNKNPFHNAQHAVHVFQNCVKMVSSVPNIGNFLTLIDIFALLIAALCHDIDHSGTNNTFHINAWSHLSLRYNDMSIMEQHHCAVTFKLLTTPEIDILQALSYRSRSIMRKIICACILSTDMNNHHKNLRLVQDHPHPFDKNDLTDRMLLLGMILHTADLCNPALPLTQAKEWEKRISQEFRFQAAQERKFGLPVAPFMERQDQQSRISNQVHFIQAFALPLWSAAVKVFPEWTHPRLAQLQKNTDYFQRLKQIIDVNPEAMQGIEKQGKVLPRVSRLKNEDRKSRRGKDRGVSLRLM